MVKWFGERRTLYIGQFCGALGMLMAALARNGAMFLASIPIISLWNISMPAAQSIMTRRVSEREQGELQGAIGSLRSLGFLIGPGIVLMDLRVVHQSAAFRSFARRAVLSRRGACCSAQP